mmetsp:Transcript_65832/g.174564  ORF Transcript_65832/g.174564 Transcript_65832/m.174564 type:complete len:128 (+) Transcript_65832:1309-1692(+)
MARRNFPPSLPNSIDEHALESRTSRILRGTRDTFYTSVIMIVESHRQIRYGARVIRRNAKDDTHIRKPSITTTSRSLSLPGCCLIDVAISNARGKGMTVDESDDNIHDRGVIEEQTVTASKKVSFAI